MSAHTAGPWKVLESARGKFEHGIGTANSAPIAAMIAYVCVKSKGTDKESRLANANLIAAAPELLAALQTLERAIANNEPFSRAEHEQAKAAIAKATQ